MVNGWRVLRVTEWVQNAVQLDYLGWIPQSVAPTTNY